MIGILGGTSLMESSLFSDCTETTITTLYGDAVAFVGDGFAFIQRHGRPADTPPHRINHHANIAAFRDHGATAIVAVNSTGSLKQAIPPGSLVVPDDYFNLVDPPTFFDEKMTFTVPSLDASVRRRIIDTIADLGFDCVSGGVYFQVQGPILETPAEIRFASGIGDVIGMTMAREAILACELGLAYASVCMVDNYANGIAEKPLTLDDIDVHRSRNLGRLEAIIKRLITDGSVTDA